MGYQGRDCIINLNTTCLNDNFTCDECDFNGNDTVAVNECIHDCIDHKCQPHPGNYLKYLKSENLINLYHIYYRKCKIRQYYL